KVVKDTIGKSAIVQKASTYNAENSATKIYLMDLKIGSKETLSQEERSKVIASLKKEFNLKEDTNTTVNSIEPFIGKEILNNGLLAVFWSSFIIILYVWWRFKIMSGLSAGVMAVLALLHDVLIMFTVYILFKIPLNDSFIAAVLTVIGYSMNDTIIIYDRIRENSNLLRKTPIAELVNRSVVQTLNRSINTVVTVLICIITVFIFASYNNITSIKYFTLPLIVGIASGMYSSIFVASSLFVVWKEHLLKKKIAGKVAKSKA
ncbi:MAG: protein translocase subunit SecF, partial [Ruminiclostridium sp.]|nr:protein translocase subunit SecF [Ruminiclostridium sp.]